MLVRVLALLMGSLLATAALAAGPAITGETASAPEIKEMRAIDLKARSITIEITVFRTSTVTEVVTKIVNGVPEPFQVSRVVCVPETKTEVQTFKQLRAVHPNGKEVSAKRLAGITAALPVFVSTDPSGNISTRHASLLAEDAILLLVEREPLPPLSEAPVRP